MGRVKNLTPEHLRCGASCDCPSVHQLENGDLLIVGRGAYWDGQAMGIPIGPGETAIIISPALLANVIARG